MAPAHGRRRCAGRARSAGVPLLERTRADKHAVVRAAAVEALAKKPSDRAIGRRPAIDPATDIEYAAPHGRPKLSELWRRDTRRQSVLWELRREDRSRRSAAGGPAKTMFFGATQPAGKAKLTVIKGEGIDGVTYLLNATEHVAGRTEGAIMFPGRPAALAAARELHLSRRHACTSSTKARSTACSSASRRRSSSARARCS